MSVRLRLLLATAALGVLVVPAALHAGRAAAPTYYRDVAPLLAAKCSGCHVAGGIAPFPLTSARDVVPRARLIAQVTSAGIMPPWPPGPDSPPFVGQSKRVLTAREKATLARFAAAGAPLGARPRR